MRLVLFTAVFLFSISCKLIAQSSKPLLDTNALHDWSSVSDNIQISNDGRYALYSYVRNITEWRGPTVFKALQGNWEKQVMEIPLTSEPVFTDDSKKAVFINKHKELHVLELGTDNTTIIPEVTSFGLLLSKNGQFMAYEKQSPDKRVVIRNLHTQKEFIIDGMLSYTISPDQQTIVVIRGRDSAHFSVEKYSPSAGSLSTIWEGNVPVSDMIMTSSAGRIAFKAGASIWLYDAGKKSAAVEQQIVLGKDSDGLSLSGPDQFSPSGNLLFVRLLGPEPAPRNPAVNDVQVFTYNDARFDIEESASQPSYLGVYNIREKTFIRIEYEGAKMNNLFPDENKIYVAVTDENDEQDYWNKKALRRDYVLSLSDGARTKCEPLKRGQMSPGGKYVFGYANGTFSDIKVMDVNAVDKAQRTMRNVTRDLPIPAVEDIYEMPLTQNGRSLFVVAWLPNDEAMLVYDRYDIWKIDPRTERPAVNLTNGYGRKNKIVLRFFEKQFYGIKAGQDIVITGFSEETKDNGFYRFRYGSTKDPEIITMGRYIYYAPGQLVPGMSPLKARNADVWLVQRMSATESPNYFQTKDFKTFQPVSNLYPEKKYQWLTSELFTFTTKDGKKTQAILYKPENFDSTKQYPVLFNYYEQYTSKLNNFWKPDYMDNYFFNYPMMVSRGYLVCLTDIHFTIGETASSVVNAVEGAGDYLAKLPYVDSKHYGISGGSFGGYITACLAVFSKKFAAAVPVSAPTDLISAYGNVPGVKHELIENRTSRMGVSLSTDPERYLRNSPVAYTKNATTPILIVNTVLDGNVNVQQGIEFFISLRREGKRAWMLRYKNDSHGIFEENNRRDVSIRMNQFFDHYLKGAPAPVWMTRGITPNETGVTSGFEYDPEIKTPPAGGVKIF